MSIQFDPTRGLNQAHLGAFWVTQKDSLPNVRAVQPIAATSEDFGNQGQWLPPSLQFELTNEPNCRLQMTSSDDQWMCQIQRDRLVVNWRKRTDEYPRYNAVRDRFGDARNAWRSFLTGSGLKPPAARLWEVTYVNRIAKQGLWDTPSDWPRVFPGLWGGAFASVEGLELRGCHGLWVWESNDPPSRLYVEPKPGRSAEEPHQEVLLLSLTARGPVGDTVAASEKDRIEAGIACGHERIVETFDRLASDTAKQEWGRRGGLD